MKKIIIFIILLFPFFVYSQNNGQFNENNAIRIDYLGYVESTHTFKVKNKQICYVTLRTKVDNESDIDVEVETNDSFFVNVFRNTLVNVKFKVKPETKCDNKTDMAWVELNTAGSVLNLVEGNRVIFIRGEDKYEVSLINGFLKSNFGKLSENQQVVLYDKMGRKLFTEKTFVRNFYELNLNKYSEKGLNIVRIFIENKTYDNYTFKFFKL